jgi:hypothetical protein
VHTLGGDLASLYTRELGRLAEEIAAYPDDAAVWSTVGAQKNPPGALALHVVGGLLAMVGAELGHTGYVRDRDLEFSGRGVARDEIVRRIQECRTLVTGIVARLTDEQLSGPYPGRTPPIMQGATTRAFLIHLIWHVGWHTGQVYYHRLGRMDAPAS